jgi:murein DD-endopeptidase MepM/ murein hydrolase activator NlpD
MKTISKLFTKILLVFAVHLSDASSSQFFDDFNRPDGPVGNGWISSDQIGLAIKNEELVMPDTGYYLYGGNYMYRDAQFKSSLTFSATVASTGGDDYGLDFGIGLVDNYDSSWPGLHILPEQNVNGSNQSAVSLYLDGIQIGGLGSPFVFSDTIKITATFNKNGIVSGSIIDGNQKFNFNFSLLPSQMEQLAGNFGVRMNQRIASSIDDLALLIDHDQPIALMFPLKFSSNGFEYSDGAYTEQSVTSVLDHSMEAVYSNNGVVLAWTGEKGIGTPYNSASCYPSDTGGVFSIDGTYAGTGIQRVKVKGRYITENCSPSAGLNYDGHPGFDYTAGYGSKIYAAQSGKVVNFNGQKCIPKGLKEGCNKWGAVGIDHGNGYFTQYLHMSNILVDIGQTVEKDDLIGFSGHTAPSNKPVDDHFHFEVLRQVQNSSGTSTNNYKVIDPYGWSGDDEDPLELITGFKNVPLWE